jgi:methionyl-tRNA formyltransferase
LRAAFAGTPEFALPALAALRAHHHVVGVLTPPDRPSGRGRRLSASAVKSAALAAHLPLAQPPTLADEAARAVLEEWQPDVLVVVAYGLLLPRAILALPRYGCINVHASLLPRWRGAAPVQRAILADDRETGISIMQMDAGLDTGPVLLERRIAIRPDHTGGSLHDELAALGADALIEALDGLAAGTLRARTQPQEGATYAGKISKAEACIDWTRAADEIERQVRAFNPWPLAETRLEGEQLRVLAARAVPAGAAVHGNPGAKSTENADKITETGSIVSIRPDSVVVQCGQGWLAITQVQRPGKRPVSAADFSHSLDLAGRRLG